MKVPANNKPFRAPETGLFEQRPVGCLLTDLKGVISNPTPSAVRILGCGVRELGGRPIADFVVLSERLAFQQAIERVVNSREPTTLVASFERPDGAIAVATYTVALATDQGERATQLLWLIEALAVCSEPESSR
jgi:PAS domain S-box-containing protein